MTSNTFTFLSLPKNTEELKSLSEASMDTPFKTAALALVALLHFEEDPELAFSMIDYLRGPDPLSLPGKKYYKERLNGKYYKVRSFFEGATPANDYTPNEPYTITIHDYTYSYQQENRAVLLIKSSGADSERQITLRKMSSTGQWFLTGDPAYLSDIRVPASQNPWG